MRKPWFRYITPNDCESRWGGSHFRFLEHTFGPQKPSAHIFSDIKYAVGRLGLGRLGSDAHRGHHAAISVSLPINHLFQTAGRSCDHVVWKQYRDRFVTY